MLYIGGFTQKPYHVGYQVLKTKVNTELALEVKKATVNRLSLALQHPTPGFLSPLQTRAFIRLL